MLYYTTTYYKNIHKNPFLLAIGAADGAAFSKQKIKTPHLKQSSNTTF